jgi:hypothetical protein
MEVAGRCDWEERAVFSLDEAAQVGREPPYLAPAATRAGRCRNETHIVVPACKLPGRQRLTIRREVQELVAAR